jgi:tRNA modification GTPase
MDFSNLSQSQAAGTEPLFDTIAAVASAIGPCGIAVIRISGPEAFDVAGRVFRGPSNRNPAQFASHTVHRGPMVSPKDGDVIDDVLLTVFRAPASYTGEDVVEISCHGGMVTLRRVLEAVFDAGARPAGPGEFTKRAFLNGRLDLAQAEAVNDIIRAQTDQSQRLAVRQLGGALSAEVSKITEGILSVLARIEASVDFPEDVEEPDYHQMALEIEGMVAKLDRLISTSDRGRVYREGVSLAIVGRPNVGKSSLLNALLRQARAIVTPIPGTTRDVIEETVNIRGVPIIAADTAGLRTASDEVERIGIELAEQTMSAASIVLVVLDASTGVSDEDREIVARVGSSSIVVLNKIDTVRGDERDDELRLAGDRVGRTNPVAVSAVMGLGIEELEDRIAELALGGEMEVGEGAFVTNLRHKQALVDARQSLTSALETIQQGMPVDFLSVDLVGARMSLGDITGDTASEDLIDRIFHDFCIGK